VEKGFPGGLRFNFPEDVHSGMSRAGRLSASHRAKQDGSRGRGEDRARVGRDAILVKRVELFSATPFSIDDIEQHQRFNNRGRGQCLFAAGNSEDVRPKAADQVTFASGSF
jgi:hypothetical protein